MTLFRPKLPELEKVSRNAQNGTIAQKLMSSRLLEAATFPPTMGCPELVKECKLLRSSK